MYGSQITTYCLGIAMKLLSQVTRPLYNLLYNPSHLYTLYLRSTKWQALVHLRPPHHSTQHRSPPSYHHWCWGALNSYYHVLTSSDFHCDSPTATITKKTASTKPVSEDCWIGYYYLNYPKAATSPLTIPNDCTDWKKPSSLLLIHYY